MSRTELIDVIDTLRQDETPQDTEALRRVDAERKRLTERRRFWRVLRGTVSTLIVVAAIAVLLATLLLPVLQVSGDTFTITVLDRVLTYEVDRISIVLPTETDLLQPVEGQDYVTLMTCTPYGINTHRLLVRGHRVNTRESQKHVRVTADATRIDPIITAPVIALPMLAVLLIWLLVTTRKRPKAGKHEKTTRGDPHETNS